MENYRAAYSPEDNKLRLTASERLDADLYARVKKLGFRWAPRQGIFVAPAWSPAREDFLTELCGEIGDEDTSLVDRAEERAERFEGYKENRTKDAEQASEGVKQLADGIPFGQPILIGHHSEKRARKDAEKIENGMRKAVKMWETASYWQDRAAGAIHHAKYKELPSVRARRIKKLEAEQRKYSREKAEMEKILTTYNDPKAQNIKLQNGRFLIPALLSSYGGGLSYEDQKTLDDVDITNSDVFSETLFNTVLAKAKDRLTRGVKHLNRWINHLENRLIYEKAMLGEQGKLDLIKPKARPKQLPLCNYKAPNGITIENRWHKGDFEVYPQIEMTKTEYQKLYMGNKWTETVENSHRVRTYVKTQGGIPSRSCVFLTDSKAHKKPAPIEPEPAKPRFKPCITKEEQKTLKEDSIDINTKAEAMKDALKQGVEVVVAPQLFPTPQDIAEKMVEYADIRPDDRVLEPSAGTGNLIKAIGNQPDKIAVEINEELGKRLMNGGISGTHLYIGDFLSFNGELGTFDKVIMNPPFEKGADIKHIKHAFGMLKDGGKLVAICANGPRQQAAFKDIATHWEDLPEGSFKNQGTNVNTALMVLDK